MEDPHLVAYLLSRLMVFVVNLFRGRKNTAATTGVSTTPNLITPIEVRDPFVATRERATKAGAWAGLFGVVVGLFMFPLLLSNILLLASANDSNFGGLEYVFGCFLCSPYPLIGATLGVFIGNFRIKRDGNFEDSKAVLLYVWIVSGIAGLAVGSLPYVLVIILVVTLLV